MTKEHTDPVIERGANGQAVERLNIGGKLVEVDAEIAPVVRALNAAGVATVASCSGHGHRPGNIALRDGREIIIARTFDEARQIDALFPLDINGDNVLARAGVSRQGDELATVAEGLTYGVDDIEKRHGDKGERAIELALTALQPFMIAAECSGQQWINELPIFHPEVSAHQLTLGDLRLAGTAYAALKALEG